MLVCVVGGVVGGDVVGVDTLSEIEIFHTLRKQQIIITLAMLVYTRFERMKFHTMLSYVMESRTRFEGNAFAKIVNTGPTIFADGKYNITMFLNSKLVRCLYNYQ